MGYCFNSSCSIDACNNFIIIFMSFFIFGGDIKFVSEIEKDVEKNNTGA